MDECTVIELFLKAMIKTAIYLKNEDYLLKLGHIRKEYKAKDSKFFGVLQAMTA